MNRCWAATCSSLEDLGLDECLTGLHWASNGGLDAPDNGETVGFVVLKRLLAAACAALVFAPAANAANHGWYWGIAAGVDRLSADSVFSSSSSFDDSFVVLAAVGDCVGPQW